MTLNFSLKPVVTEKAVMMIERDNVISFTAEKIATKDTIKKEVETLFSVKVASVKTMIRDNKKIIRVKLKKGFPAIDVATKLGII